MDGQWAQWVDGIYAAGMGERSWEDAVAPISSALRCSCFALVVREHGPGMPIVRPIYPDGVTLSDMRRLSAYDDPIAAYVGKQRAGRMVSPERLGIERAFFATPYYNEWAAPLGLEQSMAGWAGLNDRQFLALGIHRARSQGPFQPDEIRLLERFVQPLTRAVRIDQARQEQSGIASALDRRLARHGCATFIVDRERHVLWKSASASELLADSASMVVRRGRLELSDRHRSETFARAIVTACRSGGHARLFEREVLGLEVAAMQRASEFGRPRCAVYAIDRSKRSMGRIACLRERYDLTGAEASVATLLAEGLDIAHVALHRGVSQGTIRNQLKQVFAKLGVRRQADVVRVVERTC